MVSNTHPTEPARLRASGTPGLLPTRLLLWASVLVPLAFLLGAGLVAYRSTVAESENFLVRTVELMQAQAVGAFDTAELVAKSMEPITLTLSDEQVANAEATISAYLEGLIDDYQQFFSAAIVDRTGQPLVSSRTFPLPRDITLADREYFQALQNDPSLTEFVSRVLRTVDGETFFQYAVPRRQAEEFNGLVAVSFTPDFFEDIYARFAGESPLVAALVKEDGYILALHPYPEINLDEAEPVENLGGAIEEAAASGGILNVDSSALGSIMLAFRQVADRPVFVAAAFPLSAVVSDWMGFMWWVVAALVPMTLALFLISLQALRRTRERSMAVVKLQNEISRRETAEAGLMQAQKMEAVGQLSGGIAHDFNNLMTAVGGYLELLKRKLTSRDADVMRYLDSAREAVQSAARLTQRLLAFARRQPLQPEPVNINSLVSGMSDLLHRTLGDAISIETVLGAGLWPAFVDRNQLESALLNLAINARDAMPDGGKLTIETANTYLDEAYLNRDAIDDVEPGQFVLLAVTDTGVGMSKETAARAFDPFFTTKSPGQGTGLGLSMVHGFVKQSGGHAKVYSEVGEGTTVRIYLPRHVGELVEATPPRVSGDAPEAGATGTVLLVEDDPRVLEFESEVLRGEGYTVLEAKTGAEAARLLESDMFIDVLLTDVVLPGGMNGRKVADMARKLRPSMPVLFSTGYTANAIIHQGRLDPDVVLLSKPFSGQDLIAAVGNAIRSAKPKEI